MIVHNFDPVFIDLGVFQIRWYSIAYIVGNYLRLDLCNQNNQRNGKKTQFYND